MMLAPGAVSSALDALKSLTSSNASSTQSAGFSQSSTDPFEISGSASAPGSSAPAPGASGFSQLSPATMSALLAAQSIGIDQSVRRAAKPVLADRRQQHRRSRQHRRSKLRSTAAGVSGCILYVGNQQRRLDHDVTELCRRLKGDDDVTRGDDSIIQHRDLVLQSDRADDSARGAGDYIPDHPVAVAQRLKQLFRPGRSRIS